jgi:transmembrane protein EpsG
MIVWFLFSVIAIILAYLADKSNAISENHSSYQFLLAIWFAWFVSFGGGEMQDQANYFTAYKFYANDSLFGLGQMITYHFNALSRIRSDTEIGYVFLNILFNKLGFSYIGFAFFYGVIVNIFMIKFIYQFKYPVLIVLIYITTSFFTQQANLVRQMMAVSIFLYSTKFIFEKNLIKYFITIIIASFFHASALFLLPLYFILGREFNKYILISIWFFSVFIFFGESQLGFITSMQSLKVAYYNLYLTQTGDVGTSIGFEWKLNILLLIFLLTKKRKWTHDEKYNLVLYLFFIGVLIVNLKGISEWFARFALYFTILYVILLPFLLYLISKSYYNKYALISPIAKYLIALIILYHSFLLYSYAFRPLITGNTLGAKMYGFSEMFN